MRLEVGLHTVLMLESGTVIKVSLLQVPLLLMAL
jgi:hypothetical protein